MGKQGSIFHQIQTENKYVNMLIMKKITMHVVMIGGVPFGLLDTVIKNRFCIFYRFNCVANDG